VVNAADPAFADLDYDGLEVLWFDASGGGAPGAAADLRLVEARLTLDATWLRWSWRDRELKVRSPLVGRFNLENLTAALAIGLALNLPPERCCAALAEVEQVPGRMERIPLPGGAVAIVDYAHTPDALDAVLTAGRELTRERLLLVFGCGGDRDRGKRPLMGQVAARKADLVWITSDNPRSEDPAAICAAVTAGFDGEPDRRATAVANVLDRTTAIESALAAASPGDLVIVAGKGHEDYQLVAGRRLDLDDRRVIRSWIERRRSDA
jgi:UDP-N-acetylmuramoyl-L-alanyl-D-glutamate--2,6-diaminopimelate ligase